MITSPFPFKVTRLLGVAVLLAMGLSPLCAEDVASVTTQMAAKSSLADKLAVLAASGLSDADKASMGAALIQATAAADQKSAALQVAQSLSAGDANAAGFAALLVNDLNGLSTDLAKSLAGSVINGVGQSDPTHLAQITASVVTANATTLAAAPGIVGEVMAATPTASASAIASSIGITFTDHPDLAKEAPQIAASLTSAAITNGGDTTQVGQQVADAVAALTSLLPGSASSNQALINSIGQSVSAAIATQAPDFASTIVGVTMTALKAAGGNVDVSAVVTSFSATFTSAISDPTIQGQVTSTATAVNNGTANIDNTVVTKAIADAQVNQSQTNQTQSQTNQNQTQSQNGGSSDPATQPTGPGANTANNGTGNTSGYAGGAPLPPTTPTPTPTPGPVNNNETPVTNG